MSRSNFSIEEEDGVKGKLLLSCHYLVIIYLFYYDRTTIFWVLPCFEVDGVKGNCACFVLVCVL